MTPTHPSPSDSAVTAAKAIYSLLHGHCLTDELASADIQRIASALVSARNEALDAALASIAREQNYREYREDQDGSGIAACKEIAGYVRLLKTEMPAPEHEELKGLRWALENCGHYGTPKTCHLCVPVRARITELEKS